MKERGLICCASIVQAFLDDRKSQTRRTGGLDQINEEPDIWEPPFFNQITHFWEFLHKRDGDVLEIKCPYGVVGDRLYVRENWKINTWNNRYLDVWYPADKKCKRYTCQETQYYHNKLDGEQTKWELTKKKKHSPYRTRPSIHMPKWAARIWREITGIRVERVQEITLDGIEAEGIPPYVPNIEERLRCIKRNSIKIRKSFEQLWDSLNAKRGVCKTCKGHQKVVGWAGTLESNSLMQTAEDCPDCNGPTGYSWEKNPWVWVIEFKKGEDYG